MSLVLGLDVVKHHVKGGTLLSEVGDNGDRALHGLADVALSIKLGKTAPLTDLSTRVSHDQVDTGFGAQSLDKLLVLLVVAVLGKDAKASLAGIESLHAPNL